MSGGESGYVRFACRWEAAPPHDGPEMEPLLCWRERLFHLGLIGMGADGVGFGNLSCRTGSRGCFVVSGTATGGLPRVGPEHFTVVQAYDIAGNSLECRGPVQASSESLSHAAVYRTAPEAGAVVHVHHHEMWARLRDRIPTTDPTAEAGTPAMAEAIEALLRWRNTPAAGLLVMGGHADGLLAFGTTLDQAAELIVAEWERLGAGTSASGRY